ncbi:ornithine cyclodeaminase family protein [Arthrobacter sp. I2-34]|uniref:Ornithine cyclodeaminase family protein n=1 Tax=Arthrobacter hankyongi TaxID=2904801 RepID=A0ABS9L8Y2_9MICC|nr:ornithine cyclodeaminase family protein [Arthrobacter hankyongi]MCG2623038.1 ornithine cyclodeaminase family protein [Arthrobacter hankyongi]
MTLILTASELETISDMPKTIAAVEKAFKAIGSGTAVQPQPTSMQLSGDDACFIVMAGLATGPELAVTKLLADLPANASAGLPSQRSAIVLVDRVTGELRALLDGRVPTRIRTAAASAVASRYLARKDAATLGLVGAGALAVAHVESISHVLPIKNVVVWSRTASTLRKFREQVSHLPVAVSIAANPRDIVDASDVVCTLTPSEDPIVRGEWLREGQHLNVVGARPRPTHREVDGHAMQKAAVFVDSLETASTKSGDFLCAVSERYIDASAIRAELGHVIVGKALGRTSPQEITLFNSVGIGMLDLAIGGIMVDAAHNAGLGTHVELAA